MAKGTKTHKGVSKRVWVTGSGKVMHRSAFQKKHHSVKTSSHLRRIGGTKELEGADARNVLQLLRGYKPS